MLKKGINIICIGEILWDMLPTGAKAGGAPMNVALHLKKLGLNSKFAGRVGNDSLGNALKDFMLNQGTLIWFKRILIFRRVLLKLF